MINLDNLFKEIKNQPVNKSLLSKEELVNLVDAMPKATFKLNTAWKLSFLSVAALIIATFSFLYINKFETKISISDKDSASIINDIPNEIVKESNLTSTNEVIKAEKPNASVKKEKNVKFNNLLANSSKLISVIDTNSISGIKMINLNNEELKSLNIFVNGNSVRFEVEEIVTKANFINNKRFKEILKMLDYPVDSPEFITQTSINVSNIENNNKSHLCNYEIEQYTGKNMHNYNCTTPVKFEILGSNNTKQLRVFENSPVFKYIEMLNEVDDFSNEHQKNIMNDVNNSNFLVNSKLIPVFVKTKNKSGDNQGIILWYVPTDDFINALPEKYKSELLNEMDIIRNVENNFISQETACKAISGNDSFFNICKRKSGSLGKFSVFPNPAYGATNGRYSLAERRYVKISLHNIDGKFIKDIQTECLQEPGNYDFKIDLNGLNSGNYLIAITSDECEQVVRRLVVK